MIITVYTHPRCSTCRDAVSWLRAHKIAFAEISILDTPPTKAELRAMLRIHGGEMRRLFNTSGMDYRALGLKDRLPELGEAEALALLSSNGMLVKRPFLLRGTTFGLLGFKPEAWAKALV